MLTGEGRQGVAKPLVVAILLGLIAGVTEGQVTSTRPLPKPNPPASNRVMQPQHSGPSVEQRLAWDSVYQRSLEQANKQLSTWTSALSVAVGVVAVLVGVLAIVSGFILYRQ